jgi:hypothetical protein
MWNPKSWPDAFPKNNIGDITAVAAAITKARACRAERSAKSRHVGKDAVVRGVAKEFIAAAPEDTKSFRSVP